MNNHTIVKKASFGTPEQNGNVTIYPPAPPEKLKASRENKRKTAAYVRVSTDSTQQESSLALQKEYYETCIKSHPEYEFVGIYEDDGISATSVEKRKGFLKMIEDCKAKKIDLILTKSISRFARNLGDLLGSVNELNSLKPPVEIYFEADRLSTFGTTGEILLTVLGLCAQEESRLKSEGIIWAVDKLFAQGKYYSPPILGYDKEKGRDKPLIINEEEAKTVKLCYAMTAMGYSFAKIAETLNTLGLKSKLGNVCWTADGVVVLLSNEKNAGDLRARKTVTLNYKTHKSKKNEGEKPQYYVEKHHKAIVPPLAYEVALDIIKKRKGKSEGIPYLQAVPEGVLKGFVIVNKSVRGYNLNDYTEASRSVCEEDEGSEISIFASKASIFDLRTYHTVSTLLFENNQKPSCSIIGGKIMFNAACGKVFGVEKAEILFHPAKAILAIRSSADKKGFQNVSVTKPVSLSHFVPVALEAAGLKSGYRYRVYGTRRAKNDENMMLFDLQNAEIIPEESDVYILPDKYAEQYGGGYYENLAVCDLHKIDFEGLWQALHESRPTGSLAGKIVELTEFCQTSLIEFGIKKKK